MFMIAEGKTMKEIASELCLSYKTIATYRTRLLEKMNMRTDLEIVRLRAMRVDRDSTAAFFDQETMLRALLESNRHNRMAFEYLMAWYLLHRQLGGVVKWVERLGDFDYSEVPRLYQEALLIYAYGTGKPLQLPGFSLENARSLQIHSLP